MSAIFDCSLKPSDLNNQIRQFMSDIAADCQAVKAQSFSFTKSIIATIGTVCYADHDFTADSEMASYWQLADGSPAKGELKSVMHWENVPNLLSTFLEIAQTADWTRAPSNNKKHQHYFELTGETNRQTSTQLWRGYIGHTQDRNRYFYPPSYINYYARDFEVVNPHTHILVVKEEGDEDFKPDSIKLPPFICHTQMR